MRDKRQKFVQLAEARVNKTLKDIQLIGNLSNTSAYEFSESDIRRIFAALQGGIASAKARFSKDGDGSSGNFRL
jgi:hypothetical protein